MEVDCSEIRIRAERQLGILIEKQGEAGLLNKGAAEKKSRPQRGLKDNPRSEPAKPTLADAGIDKNTAQRARILAKVPEEQFEQALAEGRENQKAVTATTMQKLTDIAEAKSIPPKSDTKLTLEDAGLISTGGPPKKKKTGLDGNPVTEPEKITLAAAGIDKYTANRARKLAAVSEEQFEQTVARQTKRNIPVNRRWRADDSVGFLICLEGIVTLSCHGPKCVDEQAQASILRASVSAGSYQSRHLAVLGETIHPTVNVIFDH